MKKYFTKYLPVDGTVKRGDSYHFKDEPDNIHVRMGDATTPNLQKVILFICSNDINVGDKTNKGVITDYSKGFLSEPNEYYVDGNKFPNFLIKRELYKTIGILSPAATWITDGMEFDEDEIRLLQKPKYKENWQEYPYEGRRRSDDHVQIVFPHSPSFGNLTWEIVNPSPEHIIVEVRCSNCKYFH